MARAKKGELIVRELSTVVLNASTLAANGTLVNDNVANFFNDTPYNLDLVAVRVAGIALINPLTTDAATLLDTFHVTEVSRQAIAGQQEGIICNVRCQATVFQGLNANGGKASYNNPKGELLFGDFKTPLMTLEVQNSLFLHSVMTMSSYSSASILAGALTHAVGCTLYFRVRSTGY